jgi:predicted HAD superfamily Cof-like phosphohydrolase
MKYIFDKVKEFNEAFGIDIKAQSKELRYDLFKEEADEYLNALNDVDRADAIADMLYIWAGTVLKHGLENEFYPYEMLQALKGRYKNVGKYPVDYITHHRLTYSNTLYCNEDTEKEFFTGTTMCEALLGSVLKDICIAIFKHGLQDNIEAIFDAVHESNMAKLGTDGKPIINGQNGVLYPGKPLNKVMKPEGWKDPKEKIFKILSEN